MGCATCRSEGYFSTSDVREAYKALNLDPDKEYEPDVIIGNFRAHVSDAPRSEAQMRQAVLMIGTSMNSQAIIQAASKGSSIDLLFMTLLIETFLSTHERQSSLRVFWSYHRDRPSLSDHTLSDQG